MNMDKQPGSITNVEFNQSSVLIEAFSGCKLMITAISDDILRIRYATDGFFEDDFSYAVKVSDDSVRPVLLLSEKPDHVIVSTSACKVRISREDLKVSFLNNNLDVINEDELGFHWEDNVREGGDIVKMTKHIQEGEHFYGMGDKTMHLNLRGRRVTNWALDTYGFKKEEDPIYKAIPFYLGIHRGLAYGIFLDNTFKAHFDFGSERRNVTSFWAEGGEMNYYFINGPSLLDVTRRYTLLTGTPELPPLWSLGYQQSKWSYSTHEKTREITEKIREKQLPCDAIYLDIDYMDGFRCFTWDKSRFENPKNLIASLEKQGFKTVVIVDPGIKVDTEYHVFKEGLEENYFCRRADGPYMKGKVWPGDCYFPDFTSPRVRKWWAGLFQELVEDTGVSGVWNDMNEPALFEIEGKTFPRDVRHDFDGRPCSHRKAHNVYGMQMARATHKGLKKFARSRRPFVVTRSAYAGTQRYAATWTGDNIASWEHLWLATVQCQRLSVSGFSFAGTDVGGFIDHPTPELFVRWIQLAAFHPFFRNHSSGDHGDQEPWCFGDTALEIARKFINLRYTLLPYFYSAFYEYVQLGTPIIKPIAWYDQQDTDTLYRADEFIVGNHILVCPVLEPNATSRYVYLPKGSWYHYWTGERLKGGREIQAPAALDEVPMYIKAGAVIPFYPVSQFVGEKPVDQLLLRVYIGEEEVSSSLYEDAGEGYDYKNGIYNLKQFSTVKLKDEFRVTLKNQGHFEPQYSTFRFEIIGLTKAPSAVLLNDKPLENHLELYNGKLLGVVTGVTSFISLRIIE